MTVDIPLSPWSEDIFRNRAEIVRSRLGLALQEMQANAEAAQRDADTPSTDTYGSSRWTNSYFRLEEHVGSLDGARLIKPKNFRFRLVLVERGLLLPFRYAKRHADVRAARIPNVTEVIRELFRLAPEPSKPIAVQDDLFGSELAQPARMAATDVDPWAGIVPPDTRLVLVPYACNADGLLDPYWGVAALRDGDGGLEWVHQPEPLPMPAAPVTRRMLASVEDPSEHRRFSEGDQPSITLSARSKEERVLDVPPPTEPEPNEPQTDEDDRH
ncbi:hypothetical protein ACPA54_37885 [Uniformispora flossi]|uniref:hypothetical protein n=1 Tax=Uniformispora flossi TaxID=3390723 RepID=UPI003C2C6521